MLISLCGRPPRLYISIHESARCSAHSKRFAPCLPTPSPGSGQLGYSASVPVSVLQLQPRLSAASALLRQPACLLQSAVLWRTACLLPPGRLHPLAAYILLSPQLPAALLLPTTTLLLLRAATGLLQARLGRLRRLVKAALGSCRSFRNGFRHPGRTTRPRGTDSAVMRCDGLCRIAAWIGGCRDKFRPLIRYASSRCGKPLTKLERFYSKDISVSTWRALSKVPEASANRRNFAPSTQFSGASG